MMALRLATLLALVFASYFSPASHPIYGAAPQGQSQISVSAETAMPATSELSALLIDPDIWSNNDSGDDSKALAAARGHDLFDTGAADAPRGRDPFTLLRHVGSIRAGLTRAPPTA